MSSTPQHLTENDVVSAVCALLEANRWTIDQRRMTTEHGVDIIASKNGRILHVEAKGGTSARAGSARFGQPFSSAQVFVHVAEAFFAAATAGPDATGAMALPDDQMHRKQADRIRWASTQLDMGTFWVNADGSVHLEADWSL